MSELPASAETIDGLPAGGSVDMVRLEGVRKSFGDNLVLGQLHVDRRADRQRLLEKIDINNATARLQGSRKLLVIGGRFSM